MVKNQLQSEIASLLVSTLGLPVASISSHPDTRILGSIPEMDSMSVMAIIVNLEEQYGISIHDDEVNASDFDTLGSLTQFVRSKLEI